MKTYQCLCEDNQLGQCTKCISVLMIWSINSVLFDYALLHDIPDNTNHNPLVFGTQQKWRDSCDLSHAAVYNYNVDVMMHVSQGEFDHEYLSDIEI